MQITPINRFPWLNGFKNKFQSANKCHAAKPGEAPHSSEQIETIWPFDVERLHHRRPSAANLLSLLSFFHASEIPMSVLQAYYSVADESAAFRSLDRDVAFLNAQGLILLGNRENTLKMNTVIQSVVRARLQSIGTEAEWEERYLELIAREFPTGERENWPKCQQLLPHTENFNSSSLTSLKSLEAWSQVLINVAWYKWKLGELEQALPKATEALGLRLKIYGAQDERTIDGMEILAGVLLCQGSLRKAEALNRQVLEWRKTNLDADHPSVLTTEGNLALILLYSGQHDESEELHRRNLQRCEELLGPKHLDTLVSVGNWALLLRSQCRYSEAETANRRALKGFRELLGEGHPSTLTSMSNLAVLLQDQGDYTESEELHRLSLGRKLEELGAGHPSTLASFNNLINVLQCQDKQEEALIIKEQAGIQSGSADDPVHLLRCAEC